MKKTLTLEDIQTIHHDSLAKLLLEIIQKDHDSYKKVEKLLLASDPKALYKSIMKDINSIKRGRKFIHYGESFAFSKKIEGIVADIDTLVQDDREASKLLKALILTDSKVFLRSDDSAGAIQMAYALAADAYKDRSTKSLEDKELLADLEEMLICDGFGMRDIFSEEFPVRVYEMLYEKVMLAYTLEEAAFEKSSFHHVLLSIAEYLRSPTLYIKTKALESEIFSGHDYFDIARQYKQIEDAENTLQYLGKIEEDWYQIEEVYEMQIWAYELLGKSEDATNTYKRWYEKRKSPQIYDKYIARLKGKEKEQARRDTLKDIETLPFAEAITFYHALDEKALCASYITAYHDRIATEYLHDRFLKSFLFWLSDGYPKETILFYQDICEKSLGTSQSKYYGAAIWALKEMQKLDDNSVYIDKLLAKHKQKRKFIEMFDQAFGG